MTPRREFTRVEGMAFLIAMIGVQLASELYAQWGTYFYSPSAGTGRTVYVALGLVWIIFVAGRLFDIITDPLIGVCSDRLGQRPGRFRFVPIAGRRRPFIFWGSILMTFTGVAFWHPPVNGESLVNVAYGTTLMSAHWIMYTLAYIPLLALAPEIARSSEERIRLGTWIAVGMVLGFVAAAVLPGVLIAMLDPARQTAQGGEVLYSAVGYQRVAMIFAFIALACFQSFVWLVRERPSPPSDLSQTPRLGEVLRTIKVPVFRHYLVIFFLFYIGNLANQRAVPYWVELGLGGDEGTVTLLGIPFTVCCLLGVAISPWLCRRFELKWVVALALACSTIALPFMYVIAILPADAAAKQSLALGAFAIQGLGLGMMYVLFTPLIGEIIDYAERQFGERREAVFNSMHAATVKAAQVLSIGVAVVVMNGFGNSAERPLGVYLVAPVGSVFCLIGLIAILPYPVLNPIGKRGEKKKEPDS